MVEHPKDIIKIVEDWSAEHSANSRYSHENDDWWYQTVCCLLLKLIEMKK
jgi:hypothetical protein